MKRLQGKLFLASVMIHGLLLVVSLVGPAFMRSEEPPPRDLPILHLIPAHLIDAPVHGGGSPQVTTPPKPQPQARPVAEPVPPEQPAVRPPVKVAPKPVPKPPRAEVKTPQPKPKPPTKSPIRVQDTNLQKRAPDAAAKARAQAAERERERRRKLQESVQAEIRGLKESISKATNIDFPGPGGAAYANYAQAVRSCYDRAWRDPDGVQNSDASVLVEVVVHRDGRVLSNRVLRPSNVRSMDRSVRDALDTVRLRGLPKFPTGAKDTQRRFVIEFNLKTRRLTG